MNSKALTGIVLVLAAVQAAWATPTENLGIHVLPAAKPPARDGSLERSGAPAGAGDPHRPEHGVAGAAAGGGAARAR